MIFRKHCYDIQEQFRENFAQNQVALSIKQFKLSRQKFPKIYNAVKIDFKNQYFYRFAYLPAQKLFDYQKKRNKI